MTKVDDEPSERGCNALKKISFSKVMIFSPSHFPSYESLTLHLLLLLRRTKQGNRRCCLLEEVKAKSKPKPKKQAKKRPSPSFLPSFLPFLSFPQKAAAKGSSQPPTEKKMWLSLHTRPSSSDKQQHEDHKVNPSSKWRVFLASPFDGLTMSRGLLCEEEGRGMPEKKF